MEYGCFPSSGFGLSGGRHFPGFWKGVPTRMGPGMDCFGMAKICEGGQRRRPALNFCVFRNGFSQLTLRWLS